MAHTALQQNVPLFPASSLLFIRLHFDSIMHQKSAYIQVKQKIHLHERHLGLLSFYSFLQNCTNFSVIYLVSNKFSIRNIGM